jgi:hypothetical protein
MSLALARLAVGPLVRSLQKSGAMKTLMSVLFGLGCLAASAAPARAGGTIVNGVHYTQDFLRADAARQADRDRLRQASNDYLKAYNAVKNNPAALRSFKINHFRATHSDLYKNTTDDQIAKSFGF